MDGAQLNADLAERLRKHRVMPDIVHLDAASCACTSQAVLDVQVSYLRMEAAKGGQVAKEMVQPSIDSLRRSLAALFNQESYKVALTPNGTIGFATLLQQWPLGRTARIGIVSSEFWGNLFALKARAQRDGVELVELSLDAEGRIDLDRLERTVRGGLDLVTFPHVSSHRGIVQPAGQAARICRRSGVPSIVDVTQSAGSIDLRDVPATAFFGTSRKWLRGPRGVGFVAIAGDSPLTESGRLETHESSDAARVGFARALVELEEEGVHNVSARITWMAARVRRTLQTIPGCTVLEPLDEPSGIVTFRCEGVGADEVRANLLAQGILVSAIPVERAPLEPGFRPVVRVAAHAYSNDSDLERLVDALRSIANT